MATEAARPIVAEKKGETLVVRAEVKMLDDDQLKMLARMVDESAASGVTTVVLDFAKVSILPSLALGLLVQVSNKCRARDQKLWLAGVQPQVRQVFTVTRLDRIFQFAATPEAALA